MIIFRDEHGISDLIKLPEAITKKMSMRELIDHTYPNLATT